MKPYRQKQLEYLPNKRIIVAPDRTLFQGIGDTPEKSDRMITWPLELSSLSGTCGTSVLRGRQPFLVSELSLHKIKALTDHGDALM